MEKFDFAVIGAGPGGYVSAIRAAQLGLNTVLVEKNARLGGTCLNIGCIPSKALLESSEHYYSIKHKFDKIGIGVEGVSLDLKKMMENKEEVVNTLTDGIPMLMKKNKVTVLNGTGKLLGSGKFSVSNDEGVAEYEAENIVLASGSEPVELPFMKYDHEFIIDSTDALKLDKVPEHLVVIGGGAIGLEMGSVWSRLGAKVTVLEMLPQIVPFADKQISQVLSKSLKEQGFEILTSTKVTGAIVEEDKVKVTFEDKKGEAGEVIGDKVLVAVGRRPYSAGAGLEEAGVEMERGFVKVNDHWKTNLDKVYAIGDLINVGPMLAHKAEEEGVAVAETVAGKSGHVNYKVIPNVVYTWPEIATVGMNEAQIKEAGIKINTGKFYFRGNGRALSMNEPEGLVKIMADQETDKVLGVQIVGPRASDMIAEATIAMEFQASAEDIGRTIHAHPTLSEIVKEAALAVHKEAIHA